MLTRVLTIALPAEGQVPETVRLVVHIEIRGTVDDRLPADIGLAFLEAATQTPLASVTAEIGRASTVDLHAAVPLPAVGSVWEIETRAEGWWGPTLLLSTDRREIDIVLVPAGTVRLEAWGADRGVAMLNEDTVGIVGRISNRAGAVAPLLDPGIHRGTCEVERFPDERRVAVSCPFARGSTTDLEVLLGPFLPLRKSTVTVSDDTDLGVVETVRGGVVTGRYQGESGESAHFVLQRRHALFEFVRVAWTDGAHSVRFEGLQPGEYELSRVGSPDTRTATIGALHDVVDLGDLYPAARTRLAVSVLTPFYVRGDDLSLKLQSVTRSEDGSVYRRGRVMEPPSRDSGEWIWRDVPAGSYELQIGDRFGNRLGREPIEFFTANDRVVVELDAIPLEGVIRQGSEPLEDAMVWFGGAWGSERTALRSREDGRFKGWLPRSGHWFVEVSSAPDCDPCEGEWDTAGWNGFAPNPLSEAGVIEVEPDSDGVARVEIEVAAGGIEGQVFRISPTTGVSDLVSGANVSVMVPADDQGKERDALRPERWQATSGTDGKFSIPGVPEGNYQVRATARVEGRELRSPWLAARVSKSGEMTAVDLHLEEQKRITLAVFSSGVPVDSAQVLAKPIGPDRAISGGKTREDGTTELWLPPAAQLVDVVVRRRGMGMVAWRFDLDIGPIEIELPDLRGSLRAPVTSSGAIISPGGVQWDTAHLLAIDGAWQIRVEGSEYVVGELAPGRWMYCLSGDDCRHVDVTPWSESRVSQ